MQQVKLSSVLLVLLVLLTGCATRTEIVYEKEVFIPILKAEPISIIIPKWYNDGYGNYCLSPQEYRKLSKLYSDIYRYTEQTKTIIDNYNENGEKDE